MLDISNSSGCVKFFYFFYEACRAYRFFFLKIKLIILYRFPWSGLEKEEYKKINQPVSICILNLSIQLMYW